MPFSERIIRAGQRAKSIFALFSQYRPVAIIACMGATVSTLLLLGFKHMEFSRQRFVFEAKVTARENLVRENFNLPFEAIRSVEGLYSDSHPVESREFHRFAQRVMPLLTGINCLAWVPRVPAKDRLRFEQMARRDGNRRYRFTQLSPKGQLIPVEQRSEYFPVFCLEPTKGREEAIGFDLGFDSTRRGSIEAAIDTGKCVLSGFGSPAGYGTAKYGYLLFQPIYRENSTLKTVFQRRKNFIGFAVGAFKIGDMIKAATRHLPDDGISVRVIDILPTMNEVPMHGGKWQSIRASTPQFKATRYLHMGQKAWKVEYSSTPAFVLSVRSLRPWWMFFAGLFVTAVLSAFVLDVLKRAEYAQMLNARLRKENVERIRAENEAKASAEGLGTVLNAVAPGILLIDSESHAIASANTAALRMIGIGESDTIGEVCHRFICPSEVGRCPVADLGCDLDNSERLLLCHDGSALPILKTVVPIMLNGREYLLESFTDISELKRTQESLRQNERFLDAVFNGIQDGITVLDTDLTIMRTNEAADRLYSAHAPLIGKKCFEVFCNRGEPCDECTRLQCMHKQVMQTDTIPSVGEDGAVRWMEHMAFPLFDANGDVKGSIDYSRDITEKIEYEKRLSHMAHHDTLTNLPNRLKFGDFLRTRLESAGSVGQPVAVLFVDLDRFKNINDTLGHDIGDQLLCDVSTRLRLAVRDSDVIARMGGDEFTIIVDQVKNRDEVCAVAERIVSCFAPPFMIESHEIFVTASIGISMFPDDSEESEDLLKNADMAMYRAKEEGRNNFAFYVRSIDNLLQNRTGMQNALRKAVERSEFLIHYQPQLEVSANGVTGIEALVRWQHPDYGIVMPDKFISLAEEMGMISDITEFVIRSACMQSAVWIADGMTPLSISVNISPYELHQERLLRIVEDALIETGMNPKNLILEITESALSRKPEVAVETIRRLKKLGVGVSIDDFGTMYASFRLLKQFAIDSLKIDRFFIQHVDSNSDDAAIVEAIISMAHKLGLTVVAEGVENSAQLAILKGLNCDTIQGYLLGRPVSAESFADHFLSSRYWMDGAA